MTPLTPEAFHKMFPWRKYLKEEKKMLDEAYITDDDFSNIPENILDKFHKYQEENDYETFRKRQVIQQYPYHKV